MRTKVLDAHSPFIKDGPPFRGPENVKFDLVFNYDIHWFFYPFEWFFCFTSWGSKIKYKICSREDWRRMAVLCMVPEATYVEGIGVRSSGGYFFLEQYDE